MPRIPVASSSRRSTGAFQATIAGGSNGESSLMDVLEPYTQMPLMWA